MAEPYGTEGIPLQQARSLILAALEPLGISDVVPLALALGRITAAPVHATAAIPGFRASIMDGYAIAGESIPIPGDSWSLVGRAAPAAPYGPPLAAGQAVRILTGAPVPQGSGRVLPQELVASNGDRLSLVRETGSNPWIRQPDEEAAVGQELVGAGQRLGAADLARLASCGVSQLALWRQPRLGLLISGDELVPPGSRRAAGQIWESNGTLLQALLQRLGYPVFASRVVPDQPQALGAALLELAAGCDLVVSTGGVSAGNSDWIRPLVQDLGQLYFWKLQLKPGRPFAWGELAGKPFFGLPGNPVAAAVTALQLLWPALQRLEGGSVQVLPRLRVRLAEPLRRGPGRPELLRARLEVNAAGQPLARPCGAQASSRIASLQDADLLLEIPADAANLDVDSELWAQLLRLPIF